MNDLQEQYRTEMDNCCWLVVPRCPHFKALIRYETRPNYNISYILT